MLRPSVLRRGFVVLAVLCLCLPFPPAHAARLALVIGNDQYRHIVSLRNARNDARLMASTLRLAGFEVVGNVRENLSGKEMWRAIEQFKSRVAKGDEIVFFYAGHGVQIGGNPVLLPVDMEAENDEQVEREGVRLYDLQDRFKVARFALLIIDACRDNPFAPKSGRTRSIGEMRGLAPPAETVDGMAILMAASRGQRALDSVPGVTTANGLFTHELVKALKVPGIDVLSVLRQVRDRVEDKAKSVNHAQRPALVDETRGQFFLFGGASTDPGQPATAIRPRPPEPSDAQIEQHAWDAVQRANLVEVYDAYLAEYPTGRFVAAARVGRAALQSASRPPVTQAAAESAEPSQDAATACVYCPAMVVVPAGSFLMGSPMGEAGRENDEGPQRRVTVSSFELGRTEVTQGQWKAVMGKAMMQRIPSRFADCGDDCPVHKVSWIEVQEYIQRLNQRTGRRYQLPSEAQWEYAARANVGSRFSFGDKDEELDDHAWFFANSGGRPNPVAGKQPNAFGLHDMHGNVSEWVQDCYDKEAYRGKAASDGRAYEVPGCPIRVVRGGSWLSNFRASLRVAYRGGDRPVERSEVRGFRLARMLP